jgi:aerobic carbon-monoxide dehydrogenase medium subunit
MKPAPFEYARPQSVTEALSVLSARASDAKVLAGGQSLVPMMNFRMARPGLLVDINRLEELNYHRIEGPDLVIGALARHAALRSSALVRAACPLMAEAYQHVAHGPIRNRGTLCGNLCHADPASEMPAVLLATEGIFVLRNSGSERRVAARDFFRGTYDTSAKPDELLVEVRIPIAPDKQGWGFREISVRKGDFALVGIAATLKVAKGKIVGAILAACGVGEQARRLPAAEAALTRASPGKDAFAQAGEAAVADLDPHFSVHADEPYRRDLVRTLTARALSDAAERAA